MRLLLPILALLASCGGGGGGSSFTPSLDLDTTHPWLRAEWVGTGSVRGGIESGGSIDIFFPRQPSTTDYLSCIVDLGGSSGEGRVQASGSQVRGDAFRADGRLEFVATVSGDHQRLVGTYKRWIYAVSQTDPSETGSFSLVRQPTETVEVYRAPGWLIVVREER